MRLIVLRAVAARALITAASVVALVASVLLTTFLLLAWFQPVAAVRVALSEAPVEDRTVLVTASASSDPEVVDGRDEAVRALLADGLAGVELPVVSGGQVTGHHRVTETGPGTVVAFLPDLPDHARLVDGTWPGTTDGDGPVEIAVPGLVADHLDLDVGAEVVVHDWARQEDLTTVVVGLWEPHDRRAAYWGLTPEQADDDVVGPIVLDREEFLARFGGIASLRWLAEPSPAAVAEAGAGEVAAATERLRTRMLQQRDDDPTWAANTRIRLGLAELGDRLELASVVQRSSLVLPAALLAILAVYTLGLLARLLAAHRQGEAALLRARGADRRQLISMSALEGALVVAPALVLSAPLAVWLVTAIDERGVERSLGLAGDLAIYGVLGPPGAWLVAALAAAGCAAALTLPAAQRGRTWVADQQQRSRPSRAAAVQRAGLDVALVALAVLAWTQLRRYGAGVLPSGVEGLGIDPILVAAPVLAVLAATVVALRLVPVATTVGVRFAERRERLPRLLGAWQADRRPHAGPVLLLVLAVATAVLAASVATTWQRSQWEQAAHAVGADLRLEGAAEAVTEASEALAGLPDVEGMMAVERSSVLLADVGRVPLLAMESADAADVVRLRADLAQRSAGTPFEVLTEGRPVADGIELPPHTRRIRGSLSVETDGAPELFDAGPPAVYVADAQGLVSAVSLPRPDVGGTVSFDVDLAGDTTTLVGIRGDVQLRQGPALFDLLADPDAGPVELRWELSELVAIDAQGGSELLEVPRAWELEPRPSPLHGAQRLTPELDPARGVRLTVQPGQHPPQRVVFQLAEPQEIPPVAALFTEAAVAAAGVQDVGAEVDLRGTTVVVAGTVASLPGAGNEEAIAVDLAWLSQLRFHGLEGTPRADELWLTASSRDRIAEAAQAAELTIVDRRLEAERRLADPLGSGTVLTLWAAAIAAIALAAFGLVVDARATASERREELAILHTLGASSPTLARAMMVEQSTLAGLGVFAGLGVGLGVAATMGPSLVLTPTGAVPVPEPVMAWAPASLQIPAIGLLTVAALFGALVARRTPQEIARGVLRIGGP